MNCAIFGSTQSLDGLLDDPLFSEGMGDHFLQDWSLLKAEGAGVVSAESSRTEVQSIDGAFSDFGGEVTTSGLPGCLSAHSSPSSYIMPGCQDPQWQQRQLDGTRQGLPNGAMSTVMQDNAGSLGKLMPAVPSGSEAPVFRAPQSLVPNVEHLPAGSMDPVSSQSMQPGSLPLTTEDLTEQQQQTLKTIMQLCSKHDGKKARRMLSNRESARRSRFRKQAHVQELEAKMKGLSDENESLRASLQLARQQELSSTADRAHLYKEVAALRSQVADLQARIAQGGKREEAKESNGSSTGDGSLESCCESMAKRPALVEIDCKGKKQRTICKAD